MGDELQTLVFNQLDLREKDYFGLKFKDYLGDEVFSQFFYFIFTNYFNFFFINDTFFVKHLQRSLVELAVISSYYYFLHQRSHREIELVTFYTKLNVLTDTIIKIHSKIYRMNLKRKENIVKLVGCYFFQVLLFYI